MADTPFLGAEYGGGLPMMYRRRPLVAPDDVAAMLPVQLGSGANLYGYYMFHGGVNPKGRTTLEEDARLGAFNDLPISNYDFQAPLGAFGEVHPVMGKIRPYHLFLRAFGQRLAPMKVQRPTLEPKSVDDIATPRYSVRSLGDSGFVFLSNYIRQYAPPVQAATRFEIALPGGTLTFPSKGVDIPSGVHFIWPFNMDLDGARLVWATAQPLTRIEDEKAVTYVFAATRGVAAELAIDASSAQVQAKGRTLKADANGRVTATVTPGLGEALRLKTSSGTTIRVVVLTADQAAQASLQDVGGRERLVLSQDDIFATAEGLRIHSTGDPNFRFSVLPALAAAPSASLAIRSSAEGVFQTWSAHAIPRVLTAQIKPLREAGVMPKPNVGGTAGVGLQPYPEQYGRSAAWTITLPTDALKGVSDAYLNIDYAGDVARLFDGVDLLDDHFYYGPSWSVGLKRFADRLDHPLTLTVLPLRQDAPIYIQDEVRPKFPADGQVAGVRSVTLTPEYELTLTSAKP